MRPIKKHLKLLLILLLLFSLSIAGSGCTGTEVNSESETGDVKSEMDFLEPGETYVIAGQFSDSTSSGIKHTMLVIEVEEINGQWIKASVVEANAGILKDLAQAKERDESAWEDLWINTDQIQMLVTDPQKID